MGLILEFFISFFGVPWLVYSIAKNRRSNGGQNRLDPRIEDYIERNRAYERLHEATDDEYEMVKSIVASGITYDPATLDKRLAAASDFDFKDDWKKPDKPARKKFREMIQQYPQLFAHSLEELVHDDMVFVFGPGQRVFQNGKFHPDNNCARWCDFLYMLLLAKIRKFPPGLKFGHYNDWMYVYGETERRFLQAIEQTHRKNGMHVSIVPKDNNSIVFVYRVEVVC